MTTQYDSFGAAITSTVHEVVAVHPYPRTESTPAECTAVCACGYEYTSLESIGGGVDWQAGMEAHIDDMDVDDTGPDCDGGDAA